jgi:hypothetical protein
LLCLKKRTVTTRTDDNSPTNSADEASFQPLQRPAPPAGGHDWGAGPIDAFVLDQLQEKQLTPSPREAPAALVRRVYQVMHGLAPTPEETRAYVEDTSPEAYDHLVERVLASPRYGERWGRHWLDVVRFAETTGFETNRERPHAYHFRDYVIGAFNDDKPYDQFIKEQIAGDALGVDMGTGFLVAGPNDIVKSPDINLTLMQRQDELADIVNTTGSTFLGLTLGCARCHNHKFDPVLQKDYYAFAAIFDGVQHGDRPFAMPATAEEREQAAALQAQWVEVNRELETQRLATKLAPPLNAKENIEEFDAVTAKSLRFSIYATTGAEPCLDEIEVFDTQGENVARGAVATASGSLPGYPIHQLPHINDGQFGNNHSWISNTPGSGWVTLTFPHEVEIVRVKWSRDRDGVYLDRLPTAYVIDVSTEADQWTPVATSADHVGGAVDPLPSSVAFRHLPEDQRARIDELLAARRTLEEQIAKLNSEQQLAYIGKFNRPGQTHRLHRGDPMAKKEVVEPDALTVLGTLGLTEADGDQHRRLKLAEWIASSDNPLTARIMVNRLWHYHFGAGLVDTPSDFGVNGSAPTHPALLDWLAAELIDSGWSLKHVHRLILHSHTFQQSSRPREECAAVDADSRYLWRFPPRRLEAEAIRDNILRVSGSLDLKMGGPGFSAFEISNENVRHYFPRKDFGPHEWRRMVYMTKVRQEQDSVFGVFDCPDGNQTVPKRTRSTTPLQALNLYNSLFVMQQADILAGRLQHDAGADAGKQVDRAFELFYGRAPGEAERADAVKLVTDHGLPALCRALFNSNEFLFLF